MFTKERGTELSDVCRVIRGGWDDAKAACSDGTTGVSSSAVRGVRISCGNEITFVRFTECAELSKKRSEPFTAENAACFSRSS